MTLAVVLRPGCRANNQEAAAVIPENKQEAAGRSSEGGAGGFAADRVRDKRWERNRKVRDDTKILT